MASIPSLISELKECSSSGNLRRGRIIHVTAAREKLLGNIVLANTLVDMYAKCGCLRDARLLFDEMSHRSIVSWNILISGYAENGEEIEALSLLSEMMNSVEPDAFTFVAALKACTILAAKEKEVTKKLKMKSLERCMILHTLALKNCGKYMFVSNSLINMYSKCGSTSDAQLVFEQMDHQDVVSWNALLLGYVQNGENHMALELFSRMGCTPDALTFVATLKACSSDLAKFVQMHWQVLHSHCYSDTRIANTLIDMYSKHGSLVDAHKVFDRMAAHTVVSWNALISGYAENGEGKTGMDLYARMRLEAPNAATIVAALKACISMAEMEKGEYINGKLVKVESKAKGIALENAAVKGGYISDIRVTNLLMKMYAKCGCMIEARRIFDRVRYPDVVLWSVLILGYADNGEGEVALDMFSLMQREGPTPDSGTFVAALKACGMVGALSIGREIHTNVCARGLGNDPVLVTSLLDFYGKCGSMDEARQLFDVSNAKRDLITWNAMLAGYSRNGNTACVFEIFRGMKDQLLQPNCVSFLSILTTCSHAGLVDKGKEYFEEMTSKYKIIPNIEHYHCMIDMLGRANQLKAALDMIERMPFSPDAVTWMTLLASCKKWKNIEIGKIAFEALDNSDPAVYLSMASIYKTEGEIFRTL